MEYDPISRILISSEIWMLQALALLLAGIFLFSLVAALGGITWLFYAEKRSARSEKPIKGSDMLGVGRTVEIAMKALDPVAQ